MQDSTDWKLLCDQSITFNQVYIRIQSGLAILILEFDYMIKTLYIERIIKIIYTHISEVGVQRPM